MTELNSPNATQRVRSKYGACAGKDCRNFGIILLQINYIKRKGVYCDVCAADLLQKGLATELENSDVNGPSGERHTTPFLLKRPGELVLERRTHQTQSKTTKTEGLFHGYNRYRFCRT